MPRSSERTNQFHGGYAEFVTLHPYDVVSYDQYQSFSRDSYGIAAGEEIGIWEDLPTISVGNRLPQSGGPIVGAVTTAARVLASTVPTVGGPGGVPAAARPSTVVDPYPGYEGEVSPETHPELYEPPPYIPSPREIYDAATGGGISDDVVIPPDATTDEYQDTQGGAPVDWTQIGLGVLDILDDGVYGNLGGAGFAPPVAPAPGTGPVITGGVAAPTPAHSNLRFNPRTGKWECKRRRRRRLLTDSDFNDLMRISTLPSSKNVSLALAKAVGRRS